MTITVLHAASLVYLSTLRVMLLEETGTGDTSLGNTLLNLTGSEDGPFSVNNRLCQWGRGSSNGLVMEVTNIPDLSDSSMSEDEICREVVKCVVVSSPGPHVLIFTTRLDRRLSSEQLVTFRAIQRTFSNNLDPFLLIVFTGLEDIEGNATIDEQREVLRDRLGTRGSEMRDLMTAAGNRYFGMANNLPEDEMSRQTYDLIQMMKALVKKNDYSHCETSMTREIANHVNQLIDHYAEEKNVTKDQATSSVKRAILEGTDYSEYIDTFADKIGSNARVTEDCPKM